MRKKHRRYTEGRFERLVIITALYNGWNSNKYKSYMSLCHGFKGLSLFFVESIVVLSTYNNTVEIDGIDRCKVGRDIHVFTSDLKTAIMNLWREYGFK